MESDKQEKTGLLATLRLNPLWGLIGIIASVISIPLSIYLFFESKEHPELSYMVSPRTGPYPRS